MRWLTLVFIQVFWVTRTELASLDCWMAETHEPKDSLIYKHTRGWFLRMCMYTAMCLCVYDLGGFIPIVRVKKLSLRENNSPSMAWVINGPAGIQITPNWLQTGVLDLLFLLYVSILGKKRDLCVKVKRLKWDPERLCLQLTLPRGAKEFLGPLNTVLCICCDGRCVIWVIQWHSVPSWSKQAGFGHLSLPFWAVWS